MGSSPSYSVQQPTPPTPQSAASSYADYVAMRPQMFAQDQLYSPQYAALEKSINEQLYPETAKLQENLAGQANQGMTEDLPSWYKTKVEDNLKSQFGSRLVYQPQSQERYGLATQEAYKNYTDYYRNMALSVANRQPLAQSTVGQSALTPQNVLGYNQQNYGAYSSAYGNMYNTNAQIATNKANWTNPWANVAGQMIGTAAGTAMRGGF